MGMEKHFDSLVKEFEDMHHVILGYYEFGYDTRQKMNYVKFDQPIPDEFVEFIRGQFNPKKVENNKLMLRDMPEYGGPTESNIKKMVDKILGEAKGDDDTRVEFDFIKFKIKDMKSLAKGIEEKSGVSTDMAERVAISILYYMQIQGKDADATARSLMEIPFETVEQAKEAVELFAPAPAAKEPEPEEEEETEEHEEAETEEEEEVE